MAVLIASDLAKDMAGTPLLRGVSFKLERRDRMTIAGRNGAGKTTLLRMLAGETSVDGGEVILQKGARVALHDQRPPRERDVSLRDYVVSGSKDLIAMEDELRMMEERMAGGATDQALYDRYARRQSEFEHRGGYTWRDRAGRVLHNLGFADADFDRQLKTFSGGQLTRASLARALAAQPDLLLLDEPTNHLDITSLEWLEGELQQLDAAIVMVAHDRWFLEAVGTSVLEIEAGRSRFFPGTWASWRKEAAARELALGRAIERQQAEIARMERFIERFRAKATKARQAQSRVKKLEKMEKIERDPRDARELALSFGKAERSGRVVFELEDGRIEVPGRVLLHGAHLWLERAEHVSLVGPNGVGKTTLIRALTGERPLDGGRLRTGHNVKLGYLSQHAEELGETGTVLEACARHTGLTPNKARALLGRFLFSGEEAEKPLAGLSGGERRRLSLAILVSSGANVLILDEPTNHLDIESREALEDALLAFDGALILVSHDRALLDAVGRRTIAIEGGRLRSYEGGWAEYLRVREERRAAGEDVDAQAPPREAVPGTQTLRCQARKQSGTRSKQAKAKQAGPSKNALRREEELRNAVDEAEAALRAVEEELADPAAWATKYEAAKSEARHTAARRAVEAAYAAWEEHAAKVEAAADAG
ncbi:MAG TPA: ATP-binding cassette domain-containing protein [Solirubrobacteraceae bacterium]|nr:ATP-binding cassette domain-containing protein [Solirubrobacteraceae bacterium]